MPLPKGYALAERQVCASICGIMRYLAKSWSSENLDGDKGKSIFPASEKLKHFGSPKSNLSQVM